MVRFFTDMLKKEREGRSGERKEENKSRGEKKKIDFKKIIVILFFK